MTISQHSNDRIIAFSLYQPTMSTNYGIVFQDQEYCLWSSCLQAS